MVLCWIALPIFAVLGIFSVRYRKLTLDSLDCIFRTVTLRKCTSGLDDKIRSDVTGTFLKVSPKTARFFYKNYKIIAWIVLLIFLWSFYASSVGVYNYAKYGNCNGPDSDQFCIFDPFGDGVEIGDLIEAGLNETTLSDCFLNHTSEDECRIHCKIGE